MAAIRVLVTGAGSGVGNGIVKALRLSALETTIICCDSNPLSVGLFRADEAVIWPRVESPGAQEIIIASLNNLNIDVVLIGSEFDLAFFAANRDTIEQETQARIIVSPETSIEIANDKWLTSEFLRKNGLPHAETMVPRDMEDAIATARDWGYPLMLKPRSGTSSRHVHVIDNEGSLRHLFPSVPIAMLQRLIDTPSRDLNNEYTCTVFKTGDEVIIGPFTARRALRGGDSWTIEVDRFKKLHPVVLDIARRLPIMATLNVQLIVTETGPVPFELNARFSGTTAVQAHFGFNTPEMAVRHYHLGETPAPAEIGKGMVFRYMDEVFVDDVLAADIAAPLPTGETHYWF